MKDLTFKQLEDIINDMSFEPKNCTDLVRDVERAISKVLEERGLKDSNFLCSVDKKNISISYLKDKNIRANFSLDIKVNKTVHTKGNGSVSWRDKTDTLYNFSRIVVEPSFELPENVVSVKGYFDYILGLHEQGLKEAESEKENFFSILKEKSLSLAEFAKLDEVYHQNGMFQGMGM